MGRTCTPIATDLESESGLAWRPPRASRAALPLETQRLRLEALSPAHCSAFHAAISASAAHLRPWVSMSRQFHATEEDTAEWIRANMPRDDEACDGDGDADAAGAGTAPRQLQLVIVRRDTGELIGGIGILRIEPLVAAGELGFWLAQSHCGHGFATEASRATVTHAFDTVNGLGLRRVCMVVAAPNVASLRVAQKLGFPLEGHARGRFWSPGIGVVDSAEFGVLAEEWDASAGRARAGVGRQRPPPPVLSGTW